MTERFIIPPEYMEATKALNAALRAEIEVAKVFGADRTEENWAKCVVAHNAAQEAKALVDSLEPDWLKADA